jgi:NAD(P)H dehydrogenase (quinone)
VRILIVIAHPKPDSFTHKVAEAYKEGAGSAGHSVQMLDLYKTDLQLGFLQPESPREHRKNQPVREQLQEMVASAEELVFVHPLWWGGQPAILKNFIDQVFTPGFAYRNPRPLKLLPRRLHIAPQKLLKGRTAKLFITCDGQWWTNALRLMPYLLTWHFYIFKVTGLRLRLRLRSFRLFDYMKYRDDLTRAKWLASVNRAGASRPAVKA